MITASQIWVQENWHDLLLSGWKLIQEQQRIESRVRLSDCIQVFMGFETQEEALPILIVAYSIAKHDNKTSEDVEMCKLVTDAMIHRFNNLK